MPETKIETQAKPVRETPKLRVENIEEVETNTPPFDWVIRGVMPRESLTLITGKGHTSKTFLGLDAAIAVATGSKWIGEFQAMKGRALYVGEDNSRPGTLKQVRKLRVGRNLRNAALVDGLLFTLVQNAALWPDKKCQLIADLVDYYDIDLLVLDSLRALAPGRDEDSSTDMETVMTNVKGLRDLGPAVILIHHEGHAGGGKPRGSSAIYDQVDGQISLSYSKRRDLCYATIAKRRTIDINDFKYKLIWDNESARLELDGTTVSGDDKMLLDWMIEQDRPVSTADIHMLVRNANPNLSEASSKTKANRILTRLDALQRVVRVRHGVWRASTVAAPRMIAVGHDD
jgi:hypothetical protein